jgi:hypothetical protein
VVWCVLRWNMRGPLFIKTGLLKMKMARYMRMPMMPSGEINRGTLGPILVFESGNARQHKQLI